MAAVLVSSTAAEYRGSRTHRRREQELRKDGMASP